jgi:formamidopyrimidine-DNA glycosylase
MPELPDIVVYLEALQARVVGTKLERIRIASPFLLRTVEPAVSDVENKQVIGVRRLGKRIVFCLTGDLFVILHLMIAGRLHWAAHGAELPRRAGLAAFDFSSGTLTLTEAGTKRRASLHIVRGEDALHQHDPGGLEILDSGLAEFRESLCRENHTLKRALTDPRLFSGIGNAYSDEILHAAHLSPTALTQKLSHADIARLHEAVIKVIHDWTNRLRRETGSGFPEKVTAFRDEMAVHGRFGLPCPVCGTKVQRIIYAENETNYCPRCQTGGKLLADRSLSRLLHDDWPKTIEEMEEGG